MWNRREILQAGGTAVVAAMAGTPAALLAQAGTLAVDVDLNREEGELPHIWSRCAGSDRAGITLREEWRRDLDRFHKETGLKRVRFHGILDDDLGVWPYGREPNFQNIDAVYDGLLDRGVQPFVELSFMPRRLASGNLRFGLYGANITPPLSLDGWGEFIQTFMRHLVARYGKAEVAQWYFEIWNEPNLSFFWSGSQQQYFDLYKVTAKAVKAAGPDPRVGGPATAATQWIDAFLAFCARQDAPLDFVSTHLYAGDRQADVFGADRHLGQNAVIPAAMAEVRARIDATRFKGAPLWLSEWSSDSPAMIAHVLASCLPYCHAMSQWAMSSEFEEITVADFVLKEGDNGWGMLARHGIAKPAFNTYKLMHHLGDRRLAASGPALASRRGGGAVVLVWNLAEVRQPSGIPGMSNERQVSGEARRIHVRLRGAHAGRPVEVRYVDMERGSPYPMWRRLGSPQYPTRAELARIRAFAEIAPPERHLLGRDGTLVLELPPEGVALIELG